MAMVKGGAVRLSIEVDGRLQFSLPGKPVYPSLGVDTILHPTFDWQLQSSEAGKRTAELSYVSGGMSWHADYNIVSPEKGDVADIVGWVTLDNQSGKTFEDAHIKLMAGDVSKIQQPAGYGYAMNAMATLETGRPVVTEKTFDEYHLYTLERATTLPPREVNHMQFLPPTDVPANPL